MAMGVIVLDLRPGLRIGPFSLAFAQVEQQPNIYDVVQTLVCGQVSGDYLYNYFTRGLDILFDGQTHKIKKFVLHINYPGHVDVNSNIKCNFINFGSDVEGSFEDASKWQQTDDCTKWQQVKIIHFSATCITFVAMGILQVFQVMKNGYTATVTLSHS